MIRVELEQAELDIVMLATLRWWGLLVARQEPDADTVKDVLLKLAQADLEAR